MTVNLMLGWTITKEGEKSSRPFVIPRETLIKHIAVLGASGSGKTVALKRIIEELALSGIPVIILDMKGDMSNLAISVSNEELVKRKHGTEHGEDWRDKVEVRVFTPASVKGIQINCSPLRPIPPNIPDEDVAQLLDMTVEAVLAALQYKFSDDNSEYKVLKAYFYSLLDNARREHKYPNTLTELRELVDEYSGPKDIMDIVKSRKPRIIENLVAAMTGLEGVLYTAGVPLSIPLLLTSIDPNKTPVSILHLGRLTTVEQKQQVSCILGMQVYSYLLQHPTDHLQMALVLDEVQDIMPADPYQPASKRMFGKLFRQARGYGCGMMIATQNWAATSYQHLGQASTIIVGKAITVQDIDKTREFFRNHVEGVGDIDVVIKAIPTFAPGDFYIASPDNWKVAHRVKFQMPLTEHGTSIPIENVDRCNPDYVKQYFAAMALNATVNNERKAKKGMLPVHTVQTDYACPNCGNKLTWVQEFKRYWCARERQYI